MTSQYSALHDLIVPVLRGLTDDGVRAHHIALRLSREFTLVPKRKGKKRRKHVKAVAAAFLAQPAVDGAVHDFPTMHPDDRTYWIDTVAFIIDKHEELNR